MKLFFILLSLVIYAFSSVMLVEDIPKRSILLRRPNSKTDKTSTTAAPEETEFVEEEYDNHEQPLDEEEGIFTSSTTTTTTEAPKKIGPIIRPFRSNDDFLSSLKRRQLNAKKVFTKQEQSTAKVHKPTQNVEETNDSEEVAPSPIQSTSKFKGNAAFNRRKQSKPSKLDQENEDGDSFAEEATSAVKRPGRLILRTRN